MAKLKENQIRRAAQFYSGEFKQKVVEEYLSTGVSKMFLLRKYDIRFKSAIQVWLRAFGKEALLSTVSEPTNAIFATVPKTIPIEPCEQDALKRRIKDLEQQLEDEKLRSLAFSRMIEIAEAEFHVPIRKKSNTK